MNEIDTIIENNPRIFNVPDLEREQVIAEIVQAMAGVIAKRSQARAEREFRRALDLSLDKQRRRAANEVEFNAWITLINAPGTEAAQ